MTIKIGILSDTHIRGNRSLPRYVWESLKNVDLILHAGDIVTSDVLSDLKSISEVHAVRGNCDGWELADLPDHKIIECGNFQIGLIHGYIGQGKSTPDRAFNYFKDLQVQAVVFGHSHQPYLEWRDGILLFNPGSATDKRREPFYSFGIIETSRDNIEATHYYF